MHERMTDVRCARCHALLSAAEYHAKRCACGGGVRRQRHATPFWAGAFLAFILAVAIVIFGVCMTLGSELGYMLAGGGG